MTRAVVLIAGLFFAACAGSQIGVMQFPQGKVQHVVRANEIPWKPCPPTLPLGCEMAILDGDPKKADLFTVRVRILDGMTIPPHWHPQDERVTIISGSVAVAFGQDTTRERATVFGAGDYYVNARNKIHSVWIEGPTIIQITGIGPWESIHLDTHCQAKRGQMHPCAATDKETPDSRSPQ